MISTFLEWKKAKRTGFFSLFLWGGIVAGTVPIVQIAVRSEMYLIPQPNPVQILFCRNWQIMAMFNMLLVVAGSCLLYHIEYAHYAMEKWKSLPIRESSIFFGKVILTIMMSLLLLVIEGGVMAFCSYRWFEIGNGFLKELWKSFGYAFLLMLPCIILSLLISKACKNMWVSLGIGVVCVFVATMLPTDNFLLSLFPFATSFQMLASTNKATAVHYIYGAVLEFIILGMTELLLGNIRRSL